MKKGLTYGAIPRHPYQRRAVMFQASFGQLAVAYTNFQTRTIDVLQSQYHITLKTMP